MTTSSSFSGPPSLENYFGLQIGHEYQSQVQRFGGALTRVQVITWTNPYLGLVITPYIPGKSSTFSETIKPSFLNKDIVVIILSKLDLKNVLNFSSVCK